MPEILLKIVLPSVGLLIILLCVGAYFFKYGSSMKDKVQEIKILGADMKISIITVFVLIGLIFIFAGTYFNVIDSNIKITRLLEDNKDANNRYEAKISALESENRVLRQSQNKSLDYFLDLSSLQNLPDPSKLKIYYTLWDQDDDRQIPLNCTLVRKGDANRILVSIPDITSKTLISSLVVEDMSSKRKWHVKSFWPLFPSLKLEPEI